MTHPNNSLAAAVAQMIQLEVRPWLSQIQRLILDHMDTRPVLLRRKHSATRLPSP